MSASWVVGSSVSSQSKTIFRIPGLSVVGDDGGETGIGSIAEVRRRRGCSVLGSFGRTHRPIIKRNPTSFTPSARRRVLAAGTARTPGARAAASGPACPSGRCRGGGGGAVAGTDGPEQLVVEKMADEQAGLFTCLLESARSQQFDDASDSARKTYWRLKVPPLYGILILIPS